MQDQAAKTTLKVLVIEDQELVQRMYQEKLMQEGYEVFTAQNGAAGFEALKAHQPDVVLCDIMMPGTSGLQFLEMRKEDEALAAVPVIMLTNLDDKEYVEAALGLGAVDYVSKEEDPQVVVNKIEEQLAA